MKIIRGSLEVIEIFNGFTLYGKSAEYPNFDGFIAHMGDGVDNDLFAGYNPNEDWDLPDAYGFELVEAGYNV